MNNFEEKLNELIDVLKEQEEIKRYLSIEKELENNEKIKNKIEAFKKFQKKIVLYENKNETLPVEAQNEYDKLYDELLNIPIFNEYLSLQEEINDVIQQITDIIEKEINN